MLKHMVALHRGLEEGASPLIWGEEESRSSGTSSVLFRHPLNLSLQLFFFLFLFFTHFADKKSEPGQGHGASKGRRDLNTVPLVLSAFTTYFLWNLLYITWAFSLSLCCLHFCLILKNNFRTRMNKNNLLIFLWHPAVIMRLGVSCKGLLQILCLPLTYLLSSFDLWQISCTFDFWQISYYCVRGVSSPIKL